MKPQLLKACFSPEDLADVKRVLDRVPWRHVVDDQVRRNLEEIHHPPLHWLHFRLRHRVCEALGFAAEDIMPSCLYSMRYPPDSELRWHRDHAGCEWTLSIPVDDGGVPWEIKFKPHGDPTNIVTLMAEMGDAIFYHRMDTHGRKVRGANEPPYTVALFHYVSSHFRESFYP